MCARLHGGRIKDILYLSAQPHHQRQQFIPSETELSGSHCKKPVDKHNFDSTKMTLSRENWFVSKFLVQKMS